MILLKCFYYPLPLWRVNDGHGEYSNGLFITPLNEGGDVLCALTCIKNVNGVRRETPHTGAY